MQARRQAGRQVVMLRHTDRQASRQARRPPEAPEKGVQKGGWGPRGPKGPLYIIDLHGGALTKKRPQKGNPRGGSQGGSKRRPPGEKTVTTAARRPPGGPGRAQEAPEEGSKSGVGGPEAQKDHFT